VVSAGPLLVGKPKPAPIVAAPDTKPEREAPPPARHNAQMMLKECYHPKKDELLTEAGEPNNEPI